MNTVKLFCKEQLLAPVMADMMKSNVKYWPIRRYLDWENNRGSMGYKLEMDADHSIVPFLILKYDLKTLNEDEDDV
jgi:hypothetical protein